MLVLATIYVGWLAERFEGKSGADSRGIAEEVLKHKSVKRLTQVEIAERTGAPLGTVKSRMRLGLLAMRQYLVGAGDGRDAGTLGGEP